MNTITEPVTVKRLIARLKEYDENAIITMPASNDDGAADAYLMVGNDTVLGLVDYYNSDSVEFLWENNINQVIKHKSHMLINLMNIWACQ